MPGVGSSVLSGAASGASLGAVAGPYGAAIGGVAGGLMGLIEGKKQKNEAADLLKKTKYPDYKLPSEILQNQKLARMRANVGLPSEQYKMAQQNINRQQSAAIKGAQDRRQGQAAVANANQVATDAQLNLDAMNGKARMDNERQLMGVNNTVAQYKDTGWAWNTQNKYNKDYNYAMSLKGYGNQNQMAGIDSLGAAVSSLPWDQWITGKTPSATGGYYGGGATVMPVSNGIPRRWPR